MNAQPAEETFTAEERDAMRERAKELKAQARSAKSANKAEQEAAAVLAKIAELDAPDRALAERIHAIIAEHAPVLAPKLWYGMPAYARDGKIVCFFQGADKFKVRYATLGFNEDANLDEGTMWPTAFALTKLTKADEKRIGELVKRAAN
jgi:uncharacterized protein YdhG (YjbR/CyaY superfamily)